MRAVEHPREFSSASTEVDRIRLTGLARTKIRDVECLLVEAGVGAYISRLVGDMSKR
jgi:hypothetical protein